MAAAVPQAVPLEVATLLAAHAQAAVRSAAVIDKRKIRKGSPPKSPHKGGFSVATAPLASKVRTMSKSVLTEVPVVNITSMMD